MVVKMIWYSNFLRFIRKSLLKKNWKLQQKPSKIHRQLPHNLLDSQMSVSLSTPQAQKICHLQPQESSSLREWEPPVLPDPATLEGSLLARALRVQPTNKDSATCSRQSTMLSWVMVHKMRLLSKVRKLFTVLTLRAVCRGCHRTLAMFKMSQKHQKKRRWRMRSHRSQIKMQSSRQVKWGIRMRALGWMFKIQAM